MSTEAEDLIAEARQWPRDMGEGVLMNALTAALSSSMQEVEALRAENAELTSMQCDATHTTLRSLQAERDAAVATIESVRAAIYDPKYGHDLEWVRLNIRAAVAARPALPEGEKQ